MTRLSESELAAGLAGLGGWSVEGGEIVRAFEFATFVEAMAFVTRVADVAEAAYHHPAIDIHYNRGHRVRIRLTSYDAGGITDKDLRLAAEIDRAGR